MCPPVTIRQIYLKGRQLLTEAGLESPAFDAMFLLEASFGIADRAALSLRGNEAVSPQAARAYFSLIERRRREPLQYILGRWEFDGMALSVGEGVLAPREDTLTLAEAAQDALAGHSAPRILDLCAGSGAVGLSLARRIPDARVTCVELSDRALPYLRRNIADYGDRRVEAVQWDVLTPPDDSFGQFDAIVSNPPYILTQDIPSLQWEVQCEPRMALDGGEDGLCFYRAICRGWTKLLLPGGVIAFEIGYDIFDDVTDVMREYGFRDIGVKKDMGGVNRCVYSELIVG